MGSTYEEGQENMSFFIIEHGKSNKNVFEILSYEFKNLSISKPKILMIMLHNSKCCGLSCALVRSRNDLV